MPRALIMTKQAILRRQLYREKVRINKHNARCCKKHHAKGIKRRLKRMKRNAAKRARKAARGR